MTEEESGQEEASSSGRDASWPQEHLTSPLIHFIYKSLARGQYVMPALTAEGPLHQVCLYLTPEDCNARP